MPVMEGSLKSGAMSPALLPCWSPPLPFYFSYLGTSGSLRELEHALAAGTC